MRMQQMMSRVQPAMWIKKFAAAERFFANKDFMEYTWRHAVLSMLRDKCRTLDALGNEHDSTLYLCFPDRIRW